MYILHIDLIYGTVVSIYGRYYSLLTLTKVDCRYTYACRCIHRYAKSCSIFRLTWKSARDQYARIFSLYVSFCRLYLGVANPEFANRPAENSKSENAEFSIDTTVLIVGRVSIFQHRLTQYLATQPGFLHPSMERGKKLRNRRRVYRDLKNCAANFILPASLFLSVSLLNKMIVLLQRFKFDLNLHLINTL